MTNQFLLAVSLFPFGALASESSNVCSSRPELPHKHGASLIQTRGVVSNGRNHASDSPQISAFDRDYISDANNPLDAYYASQEDAQGTTRNSAATASATTPSSSTPASNVPLTNTKPLSSDSRNPKRLISENEVFPDTLDPWERDLLVNGNGYDSGSATQGGNTGGILAGGTTMRLPRTPAVCITREDAQATHMGYTTAPSGTPCLFGVDERDEGSHCILDGGVYGTFGWCWTSQNKDTFGSCSQSCPLFGYAKLVGDKIDSLDATVREHQAWERWIATSTTTTEAPSTTGTSTTVVTTTNVVTTTTVATTTVAAAANKTAASSQNASQTAPNETQPAKATGAASTPAAGATASPAAISETAASANAETAKASANSEIAASSQTPGAGGQAAAAQTTRAKGDASKQGDADQQGDAATRGGTS